MTTRKEIDSTVTDAADSRRRAMLAGLELSHVLHQLANTLASSPDLCGNRCGALRVEDREAYARRRTCPCREAAK